MKFSSSLTNRANNENKIKRIPDEWLNYTSHLFLSSISHKMYGTVIYY